LAILNSNFFAWYADQEYWNEDLNRLKLNKGNMVKAPIPDRTEEQKAELTELVQRILDDPDSPEVFDIETEIDESVYKLYELTDAEIRLIKKGSDQ